MLVYAGKTYSARYTKKAPIHVAVLASEEESETRALCHGMVIAPINNSKQVEVTCQACVESLMLINAA